MRAIGTQQTLRREMMGSSAILNRTSFDSQHADLNILPPCSDFMTFWVNCTNCGYLLDSANACASVILNPTELRQLTRQSQYFVTMFRFYDVLEGIALIAVILLDSANACASVIVNATEL
jgi:hypothetical protein